MEIIKFAIITTFIFFHCICYSQDYIFLKNKSVQEGKVLEVTTDKVKYKKSEISNSPIYELFKNEVIKITYHNGFTDVFDTLINNTLLSKIDTTIFSFIYVLFNCGQDESQVFPLYFKKQLICTMKNHMRLKFQIFSDGILTCERKTDKKFGPKTSLIIEHGKVYAINICEPYPQALDPNKRFSLTTYKTKEEVDEFLTNEFYHFKPFKEMDLNLKENVDNPICIK
jgi:hypothetical protein